MTTGRYVFSPGSYDVGPTGTAHVAFICRALQEAASRNAAELGFGYSDMIDEALIWVLVRLRVVIDRVPEWNEEITVETWPSGTNRLTAYRDFRVTSSDGSAIAIADTAWIAVNHETRRPVRMDSVIEHPAVGPRLIGGELPRVSPGTPVEIGEQFTVRYSHIDRHNHVNNVRYIDWILDAYPPEHHAAHEVKELTVAFTAETRYGDHVQVERCDGEPAIVTVRHVDGEPAASGSIVWRPISPDVRIADASEP